MEKLPVDGHILIHLRARVQSVCELRFHSDCPQLLLTSPCALPDPASLSSFSLTDGPVQKATEATSQKTLRQTPNAQCSERARRSTELLCQCSTLHDGSYLFVPHAKMLPKCLPPLRVTSYTAALPSRKAVEHAN